MDIQAAATEAVELLGALGSLLLTGQAGEETNSNKGWSDAVIAVLYAVALFGVNWSSRLLLAEPVSRKYLLPPGKEGGPPSKATVEKFGQSFSEAFFYGVSFVVGYAVVLRQQWVWPSNHWWEGMKDCEGEDCKARLISDDVKCYILLYFGRYLQGVASVLLEHKRRDFLEMQIHHITTLLLIFLSYSHSCNRVGVVVMLLLDPADVPLHLAKMARYCGAQMTSDVLFAVFMLTFLGTRLIIFPYVVWSAHVEAARTWSAGYSAYGAVEWACVGLLYVLLVLQVYWFALILKVLYKLIATGVVDDVRSDEEDEDEDSKPRSPKLGITPAKKASPTKANAERSPSPSKFAKKSSSKVD